MKKAVLIGAMAAITGLASATVITFDAKDTGANNYYRPTTHGTHDWNEGPGSFGMNVFTNEWGSSWAGFTYSDVNNPAVGGFGNEFAVYGDGLDYSNGGNYSIAYIDGYNGVTPTLTFAAPSTVNSLFVNNTAYAALDMINGSGFSKIFSTNDWFQLTVEGFDSGSVSQGTVDFKLADFTGYSLGDNMDDYIVNDWAQVGLTSLGSNISSLEFSLSSSDSGAFGMNTPSYFAIDQVDVVPEPGTITLVAIGFGSLLWFRKRQYYIR
jgi:hypothetical protein